MAVTYAEFVADALFAPVFGGANEPNYPEAYVTQLLELANLDVTLCRYLRRQDVAIKYLTAHRLVMLERAGVLGSGGSATATPAASSGLENKIAPGSTLSSLSVSQGSNSASFTAASSSSSEKNHMGGIPGAKEGLESTIWGVMFLSLEPIGITVGFVA
jgi:hypothetical protein